MRSTILCVGFVLVSSGLLAACVDYGAVFGLHDDAPAPAAPAPPAAGPDRVVPGADAATCGNEEARDPRLLDDAVDLSAGLAMACALREDGTVACWGTPSGTGLWPNGQATANVPLLIPGVIGAVQVAVGFGHACARLADGHVRCWGGNAFGQLGAGSNPGPGYAPLVVDAQGVPLIGATDIGAGIQHTCAVVQGGAVACWGGNAHGQLGRVLPGGATQVDHAVHATATSGGAIQIALGDDHTCVLRGIGAAPVQCWGNGRAGQLGVPLDGGTSSAVNFDAANAGAAAPARLTAGYENTCVVDVAGSVFCSGRNPFGGLGSLSVGSLIDRPSPIQGLSDGQTLAFHSTSHHSCALRRGGRVECIGQNASGQLGRGIFDAGTHSVPAPVRGSDGGELTDVMEIATAGYPGIIAQFSCAIQRRRCARSGRVLCWGDGEWGRLGHGSWTDEASPVAVLAPNP